MPTSADSFVVTPLLPMREEVVFPRSTSPFFIGRKASMDALEKALAGDRTIFVVTQRDATVEEPQEGDLYEVGVLGRVLQVMRLPNGTVKALFEGQQRARILETKLATGEYLAHVQPLTEPEPSREGIEPVVGKVKKLFEHYIKQQNKKIRKESVRNVAQADLRSLADLIAPLLGIDHVQKQELLATIDPTKRLTLLLQILEEELKIKKLEGRLKQQAQRQISSTQKDDYLQEQLHSIQKELGQMDDSRTELETLEQRIKDAKMPESVEEEAQKELKKLRLMSPMSSEANVVRNYLEWLVSMPWQEKTEDNFDLDRAQRVLDEDHYGMEKVKERIIEYLAVTRLKGSLKGPILCLTGPPGVGKTSLAKSVARALERNFVRISLGGVRDDAEIRGHRRTYIGAMPGKIIQSIRKAKSNNPVLLIDEIDKLYQSAFSDPSAAMLEVLDPEQNNTFMDHYLEVEYNLSDVLFLCTANTTQHIPAPLLDRMEVIPLSGYTELEKQRIAERFLVPRQCKSHGLTAKRIRFRKLAIGDVIRNYTREAGVRSLEREVGKICRKVVTRLVRGKGKKSITVTPKLVNELLGVPPYSQNVKGEVNEVGLAMGLGVTSMGGELMLVEAGLMAGLGKIQLTGKIGDVMQESARAAYSYVRSNAEFLGIDPEIFSKSDLHIHLPEGAIPKDGPSAGLPLILAITSAFTKIPVRHEVAMTGEITLRGHVTEIGGLKEKLLAAKR
ncbi:MAG TPA: endopeptidase La, partial [Deltaproteobacteria bacterium]|nr:endopeptidase La [Deltaproteobacteria bacterium]